MKACKPITVPVACRVSPEVQEWILEGAELHQMSTSEFIGYQLALAAQKRSNLEAFRHEQAKMAIRLEEIQQKLAWYKAFPRRFLEVILRNNVIMAFYFGKHGSAPILLQEIKDAGFDPSHLFVYQLIDNKQLICLGNFSWYYASSNKTHICLVKNDGSAAA